MKTFQDGTAVHVARFNFQRSLRALQPAAEPFLSRPFRHTAPNRASPLAVNLPRSAFRVDPYGERFSGKKTALDPKISPHIRRHVER
jgi:hypothetical protein